MTQTDELPSSVPLRVLESFRAPRATTNPYLVLLLRSMPDDVAVSTFGWRQALLGRYDVLHVHWPEVVVDRRTAPRSALAAALFALVLFRCRLTRTPVVRTVHNLRPHERPRRSTALVSALCDRWTTAWIRLNPQTPLPVGELSTTILLGHYRDWFAARPSPPVPGRLLCFGLIRPYKGVERLLDVISRMPEADVTLRVTGRPSTPQVAQAVRDAAGDDPRVSLVLEHVPDEVLVADAAEAQLVVLPYRELHNSSAALLALSLDRPVLVPRNAVTDALADEVGPWWVQRFEGDLEPDAVRRALEAVSGPAPAPPDLSAREWPRIGRQHADLFRAARAVARGRRVAGPGAP